MSSAPSATTPGSQELKSHVFGAWLIPDNKGINRASFRDSSSIAAPTALSPKVSGSLVLVWRASPVFKDNNTMEAQRLS